MDTVIKDYFFTLFVHVQRNHLIFFSINELFTRIFRFSRKNPACAKKAMIYVPPHLGYLPEAGILYKALIRMAGPIVR